MLHLLAQVPLNPLQIADQAADKSFKWWFLALLSCVLIGGLIAFKYILEKYSATVKNLIDELTTSRENGHRRIEGLLAQQFEMSEKVTKALTSNEKVVENNTRESEKVRALIERIEHKVNT